MVKIEDSDLAALSTPEKLELIGRIWDSIPETEHEEVTEEEKRLIDERLEAYEQNPDQVVSFEESSERVRGMLRGELPRQAH